ncbi:MAG: hypothetical protein EA349_03365 [Halomonadaceae bacterium]|nr:MAG: hypothetical protein EA349_03365 [Halomonadaceae bacterium]
MEAVALTLNDIEWTAEWLGWGLLLVAFSVLPVQFAGKLLGAMNTGFVTCLQAVVFATLGALACTLILGDFSGLVAGAFTTAVVYAAVLRISVFGGLVLALVAFTIQLITLFQLGVDVLGQTPGIQLV